jgi:Acyl-CoA carboxylase epsilon subunit
VSGPDQRSERDHLPAPALLAVRGGPSDEELAALVSVLAALAARRPVAPPPGSQWRNRARNIRPAIGPGPGAWRASGLPR